ncbi:MAG: response regulator [Anaerolineae bacterium]|nr:response regulator [Anaerolineae bacterium]
MAYILLVEDNDDHADLIIRTLTKAGYKVRHTGLGLEAAKLAREDRPDLILLDFDLPDIDGRTVVPLLRRKLGGTAAPPIVAVTGRTNDSDMRIGEMIGCTAYVCKPFLPETLVLLIDDLLGDTKQA